MNSLVEMINAMEVREEDESYKNAVDYLFEELEMGNPDEGIPPQPNHFAVRQYAKYRLAAGKTAKSIEPHSLFRKENAGKWANEQNSLEKFSG